jgi:uncharacterized protein YndB with AHSA1/START domain
MDKKLIAKASVSIDAATEKVWDALVNPEAIRQYMFGTEVITDWRTGSPIVWRGKWGGKQYEDKGVVLRFEPGRAIQYSHFSPFTGCPDIPENYHTVTVELSGEGDQTRISLTQDNNASEPARAHSEENWKGMLTALTAMKKFLEQ